MVRWFFAVILLTAIPASACMWDYDTLRDEQKGLPGVLEILSGRYEQRSLFFYRDRIEKMRKLLAAKPDDQAAIDNLAVALYRTNEKDNAIAVLLDKEKRFPDQYTTSSNLATFYMLSGDSASAVPLLEKAIKINPDAHFGREKYQLQLAKFLVEAAKQKEYPTDDFLGTTLLQAAESRYTNWSKPGDLASEDAKAMQGILGMIRFGTDGSPDLWYALGNLLMKKGDRHLAVRAYNRAIETGHPRANEIKDLAKTAESSISEGQPVMPTPEQIRKERDAGMAWSREYMAYTDNLIRAGKDPENESNFESFYDRAGRATIPVPFDWREWFNAHRFPTTLLLAVGALLAAIATLRLARTLRRRRTAA